MPNFYLLSTRVLLFSGVTVLSCPAVLACGACGCLLNSDWTSQGYRTGDGVSVDLRYDFSNQSQLRSGTNVADPNTLSLPNDAEIQRSTISRTTTLILDYAKGDWGVKFKLPYLVRTHDTVVAGDTGLSFSRSSSVGDMQLIARYKGFAPNAALGLTFGFKLPTGSFRTQFSAGSQQGSALDRGLQAGSGTTDMLLGAYHYEHINEALGYFAEANVQIPLNSRDGFKPGKQLSLSTGLRYTVNEILQPQLQLNLRRETAETGVNADTANSGFMAAHLSLGVNMQLTPQLAGYAFLQLPFYQRVNGFQLEPRYNLTAGVHYEF